MMSMMEDKQLQEEFPLLAQAIHFLKIYMIHNP
jgi:hypothetical protein